MHTIDSLLREACRTHSDQPALRHKAAGAWRDMTYGTLWLLSDRIAAGLIKTGFAPAFYHFVFIKCSH